MRKRGRVESFLLPVMRLAETYTAYCASKHGVIGLMRGLAREYTDSDLTVNAICPGFVETEIPLPPFSGSQTKRAFFRRSATFTEKMNPQKRLIQPEEVAALALFRVLSMRGVFMDSHCGRWGTNQH